MNYRVQWDPDAFRRLRRHWLRFNEPTAALNAFDRIEEKLSVDAHHKGESRPDGRRILLEPPLGVIFTARSETGEVMILDAWLIRRKNK